jgi:tetratricopeptide (TPR) repeat protein
MRTTFLALVLGAALAASPAYASEASDAYKQAMDLKAAIKKAPDEAAKAEAKKNLADFAKSKADVLVPQKGSLTKLGVMYVGLLQGMAGQTEDGIKTLREAVDKKAGEEEAKYNATIHLNLVQALLDAGQPDGAADEVGKMMTLYTEAKEIKTATMNLGMTYRAALKHEKAAEWLQKAWDAGNTNATKPLINSLLIAGKKDAAVAAAQQAIDKGIPQLKEDMETVKAMVQKVGTDVGPMLAFDGFVPTGDPKLDDKVVIMGFWNVSAKSFKWTLKLLDHLKKEYGEDVVCIAATTYYKKSAETGQMDPAMTPETERGFGAQLADQESWRGWMGYLKDEPALKAWGVSALPHFVVVTKDRKLGFAHTMDMTAGGETDIKILKSYLNGVLGR